MYMYVTPVYTCSHSLVPVLPSSLVDYVQLPSTYIMGIHSYLRDKVEDDLVRNLSLSLSLPPSLSLSLSLSLCPSLSLPSIPYNMCYLIKIDVIISCICVLFLFLPPRLMLLRCTWTADMFVFQTRSLFRSFPLRWLTRSLTPSPPSSMLRYMYKVIKIV